MLDRSMLDVATIETLILEGSLDGRRLRMEARLFDRNNFLLVTRGFNWIQERPFNR